MDCTEKWQFILMRWQIVVRNSTSLLLPQLLSDLPSLSSKASSLQKLGALRSVSSFGWWCIIITQLLYSALCILEVDLFLHFKLPLAILSWPQGHVKQASCRSVIAPCKLLSAPAHLHVHLLLWSSRPCMECESPSSVQVTQRQAGGILFLGPWAEDRVISRTVLAQHTVPGSR